MSRELIGSNREAVGSPAYLEKLHNAHFSGTLRCSRGDDFARSMEALAGNRYCHLFRPNLERIVRELERDLECRSFGKEDRTWSEQEFERMCALAELDGKEDYVTLFHLARSTGLRIHECFRIDTSMARHAVKDGKVIVIGKGGQRREVAVSGEVRELLQRQLAQTARGQKLFVEPDQMTHTAIHTLQAYIWLNRGRMKDEGAEKDISFHGLRHNFAAEQYVRLRQEGKSVEEAEQEVAELLGHHRRDMARLYLSSVRHN